MDSRKTPNAQLRNPGHAALRVGRRSQPDRIYLVTTNCRDRTALFTSLPAARTVVNALRHSDRQGWSATVAYVLMPDHLHWLFALGGNRRLSELLQSVKKYTSRRLCEQGLATPPVWQKAFHDRAVRAEESLVDISRYIVANPLRAGLVEDLALYPHWDAVWMDEYR